MIQLILGVVACAIAFYVGYNTKVKEENNKDTRYILVERDSGLIGPCKSVHYVSLYFNGNEIYDKKNVELEDENHFFVPLKENALYVNRIIFKETQLDGSVSYDHNGYYSLSNGQMKKAFKNVQKYFPQLVI